MIALEIVEATCVSPVLKINNHATGGRRTKDILGGPKSLAAQRAERTKVLRKQTTGRTKKILNCLL